VRQQDLRPIGDQDLLDRVPEKLKAIVLDNMPEARPFYCSVEPIGGETEKVSVFAVTDAWLVALAVTRARAVETGTTMMSVWGVPSRAILSVEWEVETKHHRTETAMESFAARIHLAQPLGPFRRDAQASPR
jgi:hypothetical protein